MLGAKDNTKIRFQFKEDFIMAEHNDGMKVSNLYIAQIKQKHGYWSVPVLLGAGRLVCQWKGTDFQNWAADQGDENCCRMYRFKRSETKISEIGELYVQKHVYYDGNFVHTSASLRWGKRKNKTPWNMGGIEKRESWAVLSAALYKIKRLNEFARKIGKESNGEWLPDGK